MRNQTNSRFAWDAIKSKLSTRNRPSATGFPGNETALETGKEAEPTGFADRSEFLLLPPRPFLQTKFDGTGH